MGDKSQIQWTDATWNPTTGCDQISPGCANCYAKTTHDRRHEGFLDGWAAAPRQYRQPFEVVQTREDRLHLPIGWKDPRRIFVNSMSDLFHENVPTEYIDKVFAVMAFASRHIFQVLTKRHERMREYITRLARSIAPLEAAARDMGFTFNFQGLSCLPWPIQNVWLGVSVENQHFADARIPLLLQTPAAVRFISAEPLLEAVDLSQWLPAQTIGGVEMERWLDWVIVGGESGWGARPFDLAWARSIIKQCRAAGVPVFMKQLGRLPRQYGERYPLQLDKGHGGDPVEWPKALRVREFPEAPRA